MFCQSKDEDQEDTLIGYPRKLQVEHLLQKYADEIEFYYRDGIKQDAVLAAKWLRNEKNQEHLGTSLQVVAPEQYERIKAIHNEAAKALTREDLYWESTVEKSSQML